MKLSLVFAFLIVLQVSANDSLSQKKMVFNLHDVTLKTVLNKIKSQSGYKFFYNVNAIDDQQMLSISAEKENIGQVLLKMANLIPIAYTINGEQVVLTTKRLEPPLKTEQQQEVTGKVTDKDGTPLPGANVLVKGTSIGAQTDFDGIFKIEVPSGKSVLEVSFVGFESKEVNVTGKNQVTVGFGGRCRPAGRCNRGGEPW